MSAAPVAVVAGTRPELIKLARIVALLGDRAEFIHTGQHFSPELIDEVTRDLGFAPPRIGLAVGGTSRGRQIGDATSALSDHFERHRPAAVVVQGDTNSALAGALAANACEVPLVHIEAGLRSHDRRMPEESNRVAIDHLSDLCCAPNQHNADALLAESIGPDRIEVTGNPVVEVVERLQPTDEERAGLRVRFGVEPFVLVTLHRPENVDDPARLAAVLEALGTVPSAVLFPIHPRTRARLADGGVPANVRLVEPQGYRAFLGLLAEARSVLSDSGGVQEEVSVLKRFAVILRRSTERPEVLGTFTRLTADPFEAVALLEDAPDPADLLALPSPYGDATAPDRCVRAIEALIGA